MDLNIPDLPANVVFRPVTPLIARAIQAQVRSGNSEQKSYVNFVNITQRFVNLYWIDYNAQRAFYLQLRPLASAKVNTYRSHPWIFRDRDSGERMHVDHSNLFFPQPYQAIQRGQWIPCRKQIQIHFPVRSLRQSCMWQLLKTLELDTLDSSSRTAAEQYNHLCATIDALALPLTIRTHLKVLLRSLVEFRQESADLTQR